MSLAALFALAGIVASSQLIRGADVDLRYTMIAILLAFLGLRITMEPGTAKALFAVALLAYTVRLGSIAWHWRQVSGQIARHVRAGRRIAPGARVFPLVWLPKDRQRNKLERPLYHAVFYSTIFRQTRVHGMLAIRGQQPIVDHEQDQYRTVEAGTSVAEVNWEEICKNFEYLWCYRINPECIRYVESRARLVHADGLPRVYEIARKPVTAKQN